MQMRARSINRFCTHNQISFKETHYPDTPNHGGESHESCFSSSDSADSVLDYISQLLMEEEEDTDEKYDTLRNHPDLKATEQHFYELISEKYPPSTISSPESSDSNPIPVSGIQFFYSNSALFEYHGSDLRLCKNPTADQFEKGVEEAKKFLPILHKYGEKSKEGARRPKNRQWDESGCDDWRSKKQPAISSAKPALHLSEMEDELLLFSNDKLPKVLKAIRKSIFDRKPSSVPESKDQEAADINTLLIQCARTLNAGNASEAHRLLRKIRNYSSLKGDASQRVAHYMADGLEARLAGTGSEVHRSLVHRKKTVDDALNAYKIYLASCPFKRISYHFANQTILNAVRNAGSVHVVDLGIYFGFQWPAFIKMLSERAGGPPRLRITGVDAPQPGFRPTVMVEETGCRLKGYADRFGVPFEYRGLAAKFDELGADDFAVEGSELLVVNCLFRLHSPADELGFEDCPRDKVLGTIRKANPAVFVNVVLNGTFGGPFFLPRFREALYHFSALFDMLHITTPRESERRLMVERDLYGRMMINAVACEGLERERPENCKQWQTRCLRADFKVLPICKDFVRTVKDSVRSIYHRDFNMDENNGWLVIGWKGRILYGLSAWEPCPAKPALGALI